METSLLDQGITLMLVGMGTVFAFLTILVFGMTTLSAVAMRFTRSTATDDGPSDEEIAAITAAIAQHRNNSTK